MKTILLATDAWTPQVNGVVRTYQYLQEELSARDVRLHIVSPDGFRTSPCPTYPEIRLAWVRARDISAAVSASQAEAIHIATEGPIGWAARRWCLKNNHPFTTCFHTRFPEYISARLPVPVSAGYAVLRRFHNRSAGMLVATQSLADDLRRRGFDKGRPWSRGVDTTAYQPRGFRNFGDGPVMLYVGRIAVEKNIEAFLQLDLPGRKVVVGDGPARQGLETRYPDVLFTGKLAAQPLADAYASADVFVFPSRTDTFGIVMLEAMASGVPVAAYPVTGPVDVVTEGVTGCLDEDLGRAVLVAMKLDRNAVRRRAESFSWSICAEQFLEQIAAANGWPG
ncbi:MAG: glycosyltransferase family 4 protein [Hyphomicrobiaceae bacterium]